MLHPDFRLQTSTFSLPASSLSPAKKSHDLLENKKEAERIFKRKQMAAQTLQPSSVAGGASKDRKRDAKAKGKAIDA